MTDHRSEGRANGDMLDAVNDPRDAWMDAPPRTYAEPGPRWRDWLVFVVAVGAVACALLPTSCSATEWDDQQAVKQRHTLEVHRWEHFGGSAALAAGLTAATGSQTEGAALTLGIGLAKEVWDIHRVRKDAFTCKALLYDAAGALLGAQLGGLALAPERRGWRVEWSTPW